MLDLERQQKILEYLEHNNSVTVSELAKIMFTSESTIRRDLNKLESYGRVKRTFGGVISTDAQVNGVPFALRSAKNIPEKKLIAEKALSFIHDGEVVFFDASSTVLQMIPLLAKNYRNIIAVTNGLHTALELSRLNIATYSTGGKLLNNASAFAGSEAVAYISNINIDVMFSSCRGYDEGILSDSSVDEVMVRKACLEHTKRSYFLIDHSKFGRRFFYTVATKETVDGVIILDDNERKKLL